MDSIDLDNVINRYDTNSAKWDTMSKQYGSDNLIHLGVADMDFQAPPSIIKAIKKVAKHGVLGYTDLNEEFYTSIIHWYKEKKKIDVSKEWIVFCPRINIAAGICVNVLTNEDEKIILNTPVYSPLRQAVLLNNREYLENALVYEDTEYKMNLDYLERLVTSDTKMIILTNPDNPTGRVWREQELIELHKFCEKHDLYIFSDEIHSGILKQGINFTSILSTDSKNMNRIICADSITKTFNVPGVIISYMIIPNKKIRDAIENEINRIGMNNPNVFSLPILEAAYCDSDNWLKEINQYIDSNEKLIRNYFKENFPELKISVREGTYLLWINYEKLNISEEVLMYWFINIAEVEVYPGSNFGESGIGFFRLVIACPKETLLEAMERMKKNYKYIKFIEI